MTVKLTDLLEKVSPAVEETVRRVRDQARPAVQEVLRQECRLVMRTPEEASQGQPGAQVPVEVAFGCPEVLEKVSLPNDLDLIVMIARYRAFLEQARSGATELQTLRGAMSELPSPVAVPLPSEQTLKSTADWAAALLKLLKERDPLKEVLAVREDLLGAYRYEISEPSADDRCVNRASIKLYWAVIALCAEWMGCKVEDLTLVALAHELAHAYTQLGADIDGRRWHSAAFRTADAGVKEGLAQYYAERVLQRLGQRYPDALRAFHLLLASQPDVYVTHVLWKDIASPEAVRRAMLEVRRRKEVKFEAFFHRLQTAQRELHA